MDDVVGVGEGVREAINAGVTTGVGKSVFVGEKGCSTRLWEVVDVSSQLEIKTINSRILKMMLGFLFIRLILMVHMRNAN